MRVNVVGTRYITRAAKKTGHRIPIIFPSSVAVYGVTSDEQPPILVSHSLRATDCYSESRIIAESIVKECGCPFVVLRISGVCSPELFEAPEALPFKADQRVEFIDRRDVAKALKAAYENTIAHRTVSNIAGGSSWQMMGEDFIKKFHDQFGFSPDVRFSKTYTCLDWYDTGEGQRILDYKSVTFTDFLRDLRHIARSLSC